MKTRLGLVLCGWGAFGLATLACGDEAAPGDDSSTGGSSAGGSSAGGSATGGSGTEHSGGAGGEATGGVGEGGAAPCKALPSCPDDQIEVDSCPPSEACSAHTLCGSTILCWPDSSTGWSLPPVDASFDYQIGDAYEPPSGVQVVSRDREAPPAAGLFNICYVNGFQTQPQDNDDWLSDYPELLVPGADGEPLLDEDWGEYLLDVSTEEKRAQLLTIVGPWIEGCASDGFDAVEVDNLDSYSRSDGYLTKQNAVDFQAELSALAHSLGLSVGQKNSAELLDSVDAMGTDFAIAEECNRYDECGEYQAVYQDRVFVIEYREQDFEAGCSDFPELSIVLRDRNVSGPGANSYVYDGC